MVFGSIGVWMKLLQISPKELDPTGQFLMQRKPIVSGISFSIQTLWACGDWWCRLTKRENLFKAVPVHLETLSSCALQGLSTISYLCRDTDIGFPKTRISHESPGMKHSGSMVYGCPIQFPWGEVRAETISEYWNPTKCFQRPSPFIDGHAHTWLKCFCND